MLASGASTAPPGPLDMDVAIRCSPRRAWFNLWKAIGDNMGPILGEPPANPFHPADDRIVDLGLHLELNASIGWDVGVQVWWRMAVSVR